MSYIAEYHPRINTITVSAQRETPIKSISINHGLCLLGDQNDITKYTLPAVRDDFTHSYVITKVNATPSSDIINVSIDVKSDQQRSSPPTINSFVEHQLISKWCCKYLQLHTPQDGVTRTNEFRFVCGQCSNSIIDSKEFKFMDMPSEWWHELMEFWHCHKPHDNSDGALNNYNGILKPKLGSIIIGTYYLLINSEQQHTLPLSIVAETVCCSKCSFKLGEYNKQGQFFKIMKWHINLSYNDGTIEKFKQNIYLYDVLMDRLNITASRWFQTKLNDDQWLHLWLINVGSLVIINGKSLTNALKLGFRIDNMELSGRDNLETLTFAENNANILADLLSTVHEWIKPFVPPIKSLDGEYQISYLSPDDII
ncbi:uncharacterized protein KQ657_001286 [Scheffersomyces spartinae]|uniref:E3 ubiquitin-protein ligase E3D n=1 Tax=Scheffersomyces spartinae TaxID=45513 RepID=A0A9P7V7R7_9ASCO|nr:uncharacterized protein KQ657_001286 [Scheffersomyces spartinae]KAG7192829.1 hypothetical protein KQ657_001286 [Scheffersomyces spartinae]